MHPPRALRLLAAALVLASCSDRVGYTVTNVSDAPAPEGSRFPMLAADSTSRVVLSWTEPGADSSTAIRFSVRTPAGGWQPARTLVRDTGLLMNWADFATVVPADDGSLIGQWLRKGNGRYAYDMLVARSSDQGATWSSPIVPHSRTRPGEHGFASMYSVPGGGMAIQFLDGSHNTDTAHAMTLQHIVLDTAGRAAGGQPLDTRICDCCQTDAAATAAGPVVVYRDRSPDEVRDIAIVRRTGTGWSEPAIVHADGWKINGCPVNGPAVAARDRAVVVAWFTDARDTTRVRAVWSADAGVSFGVPVDLDIGPAALGRVDVAMLPSGDAIVVWLHRASQYGGEIKVVALNSAGAIQWRASLGSTDAGRDSGFPRITAARDGVLVSWTETGTPPRVRVAKISTN